MCPGRMRKIGRLKKIPFLNIEKVKTQGQKSEKFFWNVYNKNRSAYGREIFKGDQGIIGFSGYF